jgi:hypothetical protein
MSDPVIVEIVIEAPVETVWRALRDRDEIRRWFGWETDELEEEIEFIFFQASKADDEAHVLDGGPGGAIALEGRGEETVVRVTRAAPAGSWDGVYDEINEGWLTFCQQLRFYLERNPGRDRRTLHGAGRRRGVVQLRAPAGRGARRRGAGDPHARARDRQRVLLNALSNSRTAWRPGSGESSSTRPSVRPRRRTVAARQRPAASV